MHGSRTARIAAAVLMAAVAACSDDATDPNSLNEFYGIANGASERPAVTTTASGSATITHASNALGYNVAFSGVTPVSIRIQIGGPTTTNAASPVAVDLCGGSAPACGASPVSGTAAAFLGTYNVSSVLSSLRGNSAFVNITSAANAAGEIRANLVPTGN
jgi:hypothetical protein